MRRTRNIQSLWILSLLIPVLCRVPMCCRYCVLESTSVASRRLYERHGFVLQSEYHVAADGPSVFFMVRQPATAATAGTQQPAQ